MCAPELCPPARGMSIVEVMVGMVVGLLVSIAAAGSAAMFTAAQRQGIGTGGAVVNAGSALAAMKDDTASAGLGFFGDSKFLCERLNLSVGTSVVVDGGTFTPVGITAGASNDRIDVVYGTQVVSGTNVLLNAASTGAAAELRSLLPASAAQAVLLAPASPGDPCLVRSITAVTDSTTDLPQSLTFGAAGNYNQAAFTMPVTYPDKGRVTLLGELRWSRYRVSGTDLLLEQPLAGSSVALARNVVAMRAQYGLAASAAGSTALETWQSASAAFATLTPALLPQVRALRIGVVTRSPQAEKRNAAGNCEATTAMPSLFGQAVTADVTDWQCYRYRTAIAVVPLRNLVMGITPGAAP